MTDIISHPLRETAAVEGTVQAAKLHVLGLVPLKEKLGERWERLSGLVHKLFEAAISRMQGPADHFFVLDELSYAVTFGGFSYNETSLICASIAKEVCEHLFGAEIDEISVRTIVAAIVAPSGRDAELTGAQIEARLERAGTETVFTQSVASGSTEPVVSLPSRKLEASPPDAELIQKAHVSLGQHGLRAGLYPVWELRREMANTLFLNPFSGDASNATATGNRALVGLSEAQVLDVELDLLRAAEAYSTHVRKDGKVCAIGVGVSYESLSCFRSRIRYITALQKTSFFPKSPLLLKLEQIPAGAPDNRVAELVAMLRFPNVRVILDFQSLYSMPDTTVLLGVAGMGGALPTNADAPTWSLLIDKLVRRAAAQKAFVFLDKLNTEAQASCARNSNVRFGTGAAMGTRELSGLEAIPDFPLTLAEFG